MNKKGDPNSQQDDPIQQPVGEIDAEDSGLPTPNQPSDVSVRLSKLKRTIFDAVSKRERVPQPLFWNLLHAQLKSIREQKELDRVLQSLLDK